MAAQVNHVVAAVNPVRYPYTYNCHFHLPLSNDGLITVDGFRNLLEAHIGTLNRQKQISYTRNRAWLTAIRDRNSHRPAGYVGTQASWKNEVGLTNPATSKWVVDNHQVFRKEPRKPLGRAAQPMTPTEHLYAVMIETHQTHGHKGRDFFFDRIKERSDSIKKAFCHQFVQVCCEKAPSWQGGNVRYGWQAPVKHREKRSNNGSSLDDISSPELANIVVDNPHPVPAPQIIQPDGQQFGDMNFDMNLDMNFDPNLAMNFDPNLAMNFDPNLAMNFDPNLAMNFDPNFDMNFDMGLDPSFGMSFDPDLDMGNINWDNIDNNNIDELNNIGNNNVSDDNADNTPNIDTVDKKPDVDKGDDNFHFGDYLNDFDDFTRL